MSGFCGSNDYVESSPVEKDSGDSIRIPPGYRFYPTDEELINHFLRRKIEDPSFFTTAIEEADLKRLEPGVCVGVRKRFFFSRRDMIMKYGTGQRATDSGYWKTTGEDREIFKGKTLVGMKKTLIFYRGRAPSCERTNWVMHEYRLEGHNSLHNLPQNAKAENMMFGSTEFINIPTLENVPNLGWGAGNMDMLGLGRPSMNVSTENIEDMLGLGVPPPMPAVSAYSGISTVENMTSLGWTTFPTTGNMLGLGVPPMTTVWPPEDIYKAAENMDVFGLGYPLMNSSTYSSISTANLECIPVITECPPVATTTSQMTEIEKVSTSQHEGVSQEGIMFTPDLQDQQSKLYPSSCITTPQRQPRLSQNSTRLWVKVKYKEDLLRFPLDLLTLDSLKTEVLKRCTDLEADGFKFMYKDEDGEMITIACEDDLHFCFQYFKSSFHNTKVRLSLVANDQ